MITLRNIDRVTEGLGSDDSTGDVEFFSSTAPEERASGIPRRSDSDRKEDPGHRRSTGAGQTRTPGRS